MSKKRVAVMFGGISPEHEVSIITAVQCMAAASLNYEVIPVYIDKTGHWWTGEHLLDIEFYKIADLNAPKHLQSFALHLEPDSNAIDVAILCFHGAYGEAGNIQAALELAQIPYQGPEVLSSAICFDKIVLRQILTAESITQPDFVWFTKADWEQDADAVLQKVKTLGVPVFIKPANGGSTIGIEKVKSERDVQAAIQRVLQFDKRVLVEKEITDCIEINVSVLGSHAHAVASVPEQPIKADEFLSYADKYERGGGKKGGMASATRRIPAPISKSLSHKVQELALRIFHLLDCTGVIRIDFFVNPSTEELFLIEPNTIPGSMSFYLWEATGLPYPQLVDRLVEIAEETASDKRDRVVSFESNILNLQGGGKR